LNDVIHKLAITYKSTPSIYIKVNEAISPAKATPAVNAMELGSFLKPKCSNYGKNGN
tara:strand:- start:51 stop:221 length:171 start_codon:yes stop_codon:yes gene_type:complete